MSVLKAIASRNFITVNKLLAHYIGLNESLVLGELASEWDYYSETGQLEPDGYFYVTVEKLWLNTTIKEDLQRKVLKNLERYGIVEIIYRGIPRKRFIRLNEKAIEDIIDKSSCPKSYISTEASNGQRPALEPDISGANNNKYNNNNNKVVVGVVDSTEIKNKSTNTINKDNKLKDLEKSKQTFVEIAGKDLADELENTKVSSYKNHLEDLSIEELNKLELLSSIGRDIGYPDYRLLQNHFSLTNLVTKHTPEECRKLVKQKEKESTKKQLADSTNPRITRDMLSDETY